MRRKATVAQPSARPVRPRVPRPAAAARCDRARRPGTAGAADRRDRPRRRRVRGLPARAALRLPGHDPRDRHDPRRVGGPWWCSRRTARASCTTRSSAAACTTGSGTRRSSARSRSCAPACRASPSGSPPRPRRSSSALRARPREGPRRRRDDRLDAGPGRARTGGARGRHRRRHARRVLKYHEDLERVRDRGLQELVAEAKRAAGG